MIRSLTLCCLLLPHLALAQAPVEPIRSVGVLAALPTQNTLGERTYTLKLVPTEPLPPVGAEVRLSLDDGQLIVGKVLTASATGYSNPTAAKVTIRAATEERNLLSATIIQRWSPWSSWMSSAAEPAGPLRLLRLDDARVVRTQKVYDTPDGVTLQLSVAYGGTGDCLYVITVPNSQIPPSVTLAPPAACAKLP